MARKQIIKVLFADDHPFVREGIRGHLSSQKDIEVVGEASTGAEAIRKVRKLQPDVLITDIRMPDMTGLDVAKQVRKTAPKTQIIVLSMYDDREYVLESVHSGVKAYVMKDAAPSDLIKAIRAVNNGETFFSPEISRIFSDEYVAHAEAFDRASVLSDREKEVLAMIAQGNTNKGIAGCFGVSPRTIESHRAHIRTKLGLDTTAELVQYAITNGLVVLEKPPPDH